jgi:hypothetical protein
MEKFGKETPMGRPGQPSEGKFYEFFPIIILCK